MQGYQQLLKLNQLIKDKVDIGQYIEGCGVDLLPAGYDKLRCVCPFHPDSDPSCYVNLMGQYFKCFGCGAAGDVIKFAQKYNSWSWRDAVENIANQYGIKYDWSLLDEVLSDAQIDFHWDRFQLELKLRSISILCREHIKKTGYHPDEIDMVEKIFEKIDKQLIADESDINFFYRIHLLLKSQLPERQKKFEEVKNCMKSLITDNKSCTKCSLRFGCNNVVTGVGDSNSEYALIGEAPGKDEDLEAVPFVGASGKLLRETIDNIGISSDDIWISNIIHCRPTNNKFPELSKAQYCANQWLFKELHYMPNLKRVMLFGKNAIGSFLSEDPSGFTMSQYLGSTMKHTLKVGNKFITLDVYFNYHPSYIIRRGGKNSPDYEEFKNNLIEFFTKA